MELKPVFARYHAHGGGGRAGATTPLDFRDLSGVCDKIVPGLVIAREAVLVICLRSSYQRGQ